MKAFTDIEQSKKLAEILPLVSMYRPLIYDECKYFLNKDTKDEQP